MKNLKFDTTFLKDFWNLCKPYWVSTERYHAFSLLIMNILCVIVEVRARVSVNQFSKDFYDALQNFDQAALVTSLWHFGVILTVLMLAFGYSVYFSGLLSIRWRQWLTKHYLHQWLRQHTYYRMQLQHSTLDNPDQRISEDLQKLAELTLNLFFMLMYSALIVGVFGVILWQFSGYLFWSACLYAFCGSVLSAWIGHKLSRFNYQQQQYNADFRFSLMKLRESSEQVALHRGEQAEHERFERLFDRIYKNFTQMIQVKRNLTFFNNGYNTASFVFGLFVAIPLYLKKKIQLGGLMQISGAFSYAIGSFSLFVNSFDSFAELRAVVHRLSEFTKVTDKIHEADTNIAIQSHEEKDVVIESLHLRLPCGNSLLEKKEIIFKQGQRYLLQGQSGVGKSVFLRSLAGLWPYGEGTIYFPQHAKICFLPQKTYIPTGKLKDILIYPYAREKKLEEIMQACHLEKWLPHLQLERAWQKELSLGEQQLVAFVRLFLAKPDVIFLDEATSALDESTQKSIYKKFIETFPHTTIISVGHRASLQDFHDHCIIF